LLNNKFYRELLMSFRRATGQKPERIIFYRCGPDLFILHSRPFPFTVYWRCYLSISIQGWCQWGSILSSTAIWTRCNPEGMVGCSSIFLYI